MCPSDRVVIRQSPSVRHSLVRLPEASVSQPVPSSQDVRLEPSALFVVRQPSSPVWVSERLPSASMLQLVPSSQEPR